MHHNHNNNVSGSAAMTPDPSMAPSTNGYGNEPWTSMSPYSQSPYNNSPMNEYSNWTSYMPQGLPSESLARMPPPPPTPQQQQQHQNHHNHHHHHHQPSVQPAPSPSHMGHHQLPLLTTTWPSQLTNPSPTPSGSYSAPPLSLTPAKKSTKAAEAPKTASAPPEKEKSRKTLSAEQKRQMCQYFDDNPGAKQTEIGAVFGVERSTVSKVLRQRDQYFKKGDGEPDSAAGKRAKKNPDFDRTLSNYVRRQQQQGFELSDDEIMDQARRFAHGSNNQESLMSSLTSSWLQKFKQKHGIGPSRLTRRASETNIPDSVRMSASTVRPLLKKKGSSGVISPASPTGQMSPLSESRSDEDGPNEGLGFDFSGYSRAIASLSTSSLTNDAVSGGAGTSSFLGGTLSPNHNFHFSPDPNTRGFVVDQELHLAGLDDHHREKRSNTFPSLNIDSINMNHHLDNENMTATAVSSALESPIQELQAPPFAIDTSLTTSPKLRRSSSNSSMTGRANTTPVTAAGSGSVESSPVSPSQEDARRAANTLLSYIQSVQSLGAGHFDQNEYMSIVSLTKKLQVHQHSLSRPSIGGLSRIPEGDMELATSSNSHEIMMETR